MVSARDVEPQQLVEKTAEALKQDMQVPEWTRVVKTGANKQRPPEQKDWWYLRSASVLKQIYMDGPVGVEKLRSFYGGRKRRGHKPPHFRKAGGKVIRTILIDLEKLGYVTKKGKEGRAITPQGQKFLDQVAKGVK